MTSVTQTSDNVATWILFYDRFDYEFGKTNIQISKNILPGHTTENYADNCTVILHCMAVIPDLYEADKNKIFILIINH